MSCLTIQMPDKVSFEPVGFRDVYWCPRLNEPVILEYRQAVGSEREPWCINCGCPLESDHAFICHIHKPGLW